MNICFLCAGFDANGGIGRVVSILSDALVRQSDLNIFLCCFRDVKADSYYTLNPNCRQSFLFDRRITMTSAFLRGHAPKKLVYYLKKNQIDVLIACGVLFYPLAAIAASKCGIRFVGWEHTNPNNKSDYKFQDESRVFGAKRSNCNVVLTKSALDIYNRRFPFRKNIQIYNPVAPSLITNQYHYDSASQKIISVGRLRPQKNFDKLLDIAKEVLPIHPDWGWDIYGEGDLREHLEEKSRSYGLEGQVHFMGQVGNIYELYHEYSFMVMTSDYEGFPMTLLEGAANYLPMVAFDVPTGPNEIIKDGINGFLCVAGNNQEMIDRINQLISDPELRKRMAEMSRKTVETFHLDKICSQWLRLFEDLNVT